MGCVFSIRIVPIEEIQEKIYTPDDDSYDINLIDSPDVEYKKEKDG